MQPKMKLNDTSCILKSFTYENYHSLKLKSSGLKCLYRNVFRAAELKQDFIEVLIKHRPRVHGESSAAGIKIIKHGIKRIMILFYFL